MMMIPWHKIELNENSKIKNNKVFQFHKPAKRAKCNFFYVSWMQFFDKSTMPHGISERIFNFYDAFTLAHPCDLLLISKDGPYLVIYFQCIVPFLKSETKTLNDLGEYYQCIAKIWICTGFWCISRSSLLIFFIVTLKSLMVGLLKNHWSLINLIRLVIRCSNSVYNICYFDEKDTKKQSSQASIEFIGNQF